MKQTPFQRCWTIYHGVCPMRLIYLHAFGRCLGPRGGRWFVGKRSLLVLQVEGLLKTWTQRCIKCWRCLKIQQGAHLVARLWLSLTHPLSSLSIASGGKEYVQPMVDQLSPGWWDCDRWKTLSFDSKPGRNMERTQAQEDTKVHKMVVV